MAGSFRQSLELAFQSHVFGCANPKRVLTSGPQDGSEQDTDRKSKHHGLHCLFLSVSDLFDLDGSLPSCGFTLTQDSINPTKPTAIPGHQGAMSLLTCGRGAHPFLTNLVSPLQRCCTRASSASRASRASRHTGCQTSTPMD